MTVDQENGRIGLNGNGFTGTTRIDNGWEQVKMYRFMKNTSNLDNPYFLMGILLFFWGSFAAVSKLTLGKLDSMQIQFYMFGCAVLIMTVILFATGKYRELRTISLPGYVKLAVYGLPQFFYYFLYILAITMLPTIEASAINYLFPVFIVLLAVPIHGEKLTVFKVLSLIIGFVGVLVIITSGNIGSLKLTSLPGDIAALGGALSWGLFSNLGKKNKLDSFLSNYVYTITAFILSTAGLLLLSDPVLPDAAGMAGIVWLCISNIILTYYIWFRVLKIAPAALAGNLAFLSPFATLVFIVVLTGEKILFSQILGLVIIILGTAVQNDHVIAIFRKWKTGGSR